MTDTADREDGTAALAGAAQPIPAGWESVLDTGERILWQGRPDPGFHVTPLQIFPSLFGLAFAGFALFWMIMAAQAGGGFWMFGLIHFSVGVGLVFSSLLWSSVKLRRTWYTLTDRRAIIATDLPVQGKSLTSYPIRPGGPLDFRAGPPASIYFASEERSGNKGRVYTVDIGFQRIRGGDKVLRLMRAVQQQGAREEVAP